MNLRPAYATSAIVLVGQIATAVVGLLLVEPGTEVPIHWNASGQPDGYASPLLAFLLVPAITVGVVALLAVIPRVEPRAQNLARSSGAYVTVWIALLLYLGVFQVLVVLAGLGASFSMSTVIGVSVGVLFVVIGNVLSTVRSNFMFGVRTPWTLSSDLSWKKTHRLMGWAFVVLGIVAIVASIVAPDLMVWVMLGGVIGILVVSFVYSYRVWSTDPDRRDGGSTS